MKRSTTGEIIMDKKVSFHNNDDNIEDSNWQV